MKLWIWSDLHLEMQNPTFVDRAPEADVIVCAGDLCVADELGDYTRCLIERYGLPMIFVPGNHEFYSNRAVWPPRTKPSDHLLMKEAAEASQSWRNRLYVLDDDILELGGVRFVGGTLWTDFMMDLKDDEHFVWRMQSAPSQLADFSRIRLGEGRRLMPSDMIDFHRLTRGFIERQLAIPFDGKTVVVTHHLPHPDCTPVVYRDRETNYLFACGRGAFDHILSSDAAPSLWICGHTHHPSDIQIGRTRIVCNPMGYRSIPSELRNGFVWDLVFDTEALP
ncbi:metallophosphoesterase [Mesorhizobium sp. B2-4-17]|uniref:metallophosphoesterase family protein n=1 Tax=Mesorhizobium sp. B2-4-17 TaxID=2589932 RepID=UPI00112E9FC8|nr:metallophosphoesterase [Mesorhizobium sp. B2-4-17]TPK85444.1 metallophosphoesterase [Mesorhizobium sp. B2-4-17]